MDLFGDTMAKRGEQAYDSLASFGRLWLDIKGWASEAMQSIGQWVAELASSTEEFSAIYYSVAITFQKLNQIISSSIAAAINLVPRLGRKQILCRDGRTTTNKWPAHMVTASAERNWDG